MTTKPCAFCGVDFVPAQWGVKACSPEHARALQDAARRRPRAHPKREWRICETCQGPFEVVPSQIVKGPNAGSFCSWTCFAAAPQPTEANRRRSVAQRGAANPAYKHGESPERSREGERRFKDPALHCRALDCIKRGDQQHHVIYRQHVKRAGGDLWDPDNALVLCVSHHLAHHQRREPLPTAALRPENLAFALALLGEAAEGYFARYYS